MVPSRPPRGASRSKRPSIPEVPTAKERFRRLDSYRSRREWARYEGTAQRDLFRELRERFLARHAPDGWALDFGAGPGRFTPAVGGAGARRVALDLSREMLLEHRRRLDGSVRVDLVRADGVRPPFPPRRFGVVAALGNSIGFGGAEAIRTLESAADLVAEGGTLLLETAPGTPTVSRYLERLPVGAMVRLLRAPAGVVVPRVEREGYRDSPSADRTRHGFRPIDDAELRSELEREGFDIVESVAVAPALGAVRERLEAVRRDAVAWPRLLALEETLGRRPAARTSPAAVLTAAVRRRGTEG